MKKFSTLGTVLNKNQQKEVKGGNGCNSYTGPIFVTCEQYHELPPQYQMCVLVSVDCFPR
jgi:hypothetical protein